MPRRSIPSFVVFLSCLVFGCGDDGTTLAGDPPDSGPEFSGTLLVVNKSAASLSFVDPNDGSRLADVTTGFGPHEVALSPDASTAYVTNYGSGPSPGNSLTVVDVATRSRLATVDLGTDTAPHGIATSQDGRVWVTTEGPGRVIWVDPDALTVDDGFATNQAVTHMIAVTADGGRAYAANIGGGSATRIITSTGAVTSVATGAGAEGIALSADGSRLYVTNRAAGTVSEIDTGSFQVLRTLSTGSFPIRVQMRAGAGQLIITDPMDDELVVVDIGDWIVSTRVAVQGAPIGVLLDPSGRYAFVARTAADRVAVVDLQDGSTVRQLPTGANPDGLAWLP
ncbi:MAG: hypothetical protein ABFS34_01380 [Gemmatimonadota bacterium]